LFIEKGKYPMLITKESKQKVERETHPRYWFNNHNVKQRPDDDDNS